MREGAMIFFRSHPLPPAFGRANAAYLLCQMKRAVMMFISFTTTYFWSFTTPEFSFGPCLPEHLEERFASLFICTIMSLKFTSLEFVKPLENVMS